MPDYQETKHFLLVYDLAERSLVTQEEFRDSGEALKRYHECEETYLNRDDRFEIVLVGADSIETVMRTHGSYFADSPSIVAQLFADLEQHLTGARRLS